MQDINAIRRYWELEREAEGRSRPSVPTVDSPPDKTWIWSDLHLSDRNALDAFNRPFRDVADMNRGLLAAWRQKVRPGDTIICLGDIAHTDIWRDRQLLLDLRECPGERILIVGNHDIAREALKEVGFTTQQGRSTLRRRPAAATDPPAAGRGTGGSDQRARAPPQRFGADGPPHQRNRRAVGLRTGLDDRDSIESAAAPAAENGRMNQPGPVFRSRNT